MQLFIGSQIKLFEKILKNKYYFDEYISKDKPTLFWGIYGTSDLNVLREHAGIKIVVFNGTDSTHDKILRLTRTLVGYKNTTYISGSDWVSKDLNTASIKHVKIPLLMSNLKIWQYGEKNS